MFCPRCSETQVAEDVRFCKRCGLRLEAVQDLIDNEAMAESRADSRLPRQKDISIGAGLMFIGTVVAMLWSQGHLGGDRDVLPQVYLILAFTLGFILLLFQPLLGGLKKLFSGTNKRSDREKARPETKQRDGMNLGALLMFLGTIKAMFLSTVQDNPEKRVVMTLALATGVFLFLLVIRWLAERVYRLIFKNSIADKEEQAERVTADLSLAAKERASELGLPAADHLGAIPVEAFTPTKVEFASPPSVTENTTGLLGKQ